MKKSVEPTTPESVINVRNVSRCVLSGRVFKAHRRVYHSTLGWRVIKKKKSGRAPVLAQNDFRTSKQQLLRAGVISSYQQGG